MKRILAFAALALLQCGSTPLVATAIESPFGVSGRKRPSIALLPTPTAVAMRVVQRDDSHWTIRLPNAEYTLLEAHDLGGLHQTDGRFIQLRYVVTNLAPRSVPFLDPPRVVDALGRTFSRYDEEKSLVPTDAAVVTFGQDVPPNVPQEFWTVVEVPEDATGLKFLAMSLVVGGRPDKTVDIGL